MRMQALAVTGVRDITDKRSLTFSGNMRTGYQQLNWNFGGPWVDRLNPESDAVDQPMTPHRFPASP